MIDGKDRKIRHRRIRKRVIGSSQRPRLCVYKSLRHIYAQLIDDTAGRVITGVSTRSPEIKAVLNGKVKSQKSKEVGKFLARKAIQRDIKRVVFDRSGYKYHGVVRSLAEGAREGGLEF